MTATNSPHSSSKTIVTPLFRGPEHIRSEDRALWNKKLSPKEFEAVIAGSSVQTRANISRLLVAALVAEKTGGDLASVEGWEGHEIESKTGESTEYVTGSWFERLLLKALRRRGLIGQETDIERVDVSRCTEEEARAVQALLPDNARGRIIAITQTPNPSPLRAKWTIKRNTKHGVEVHSPEEAIRAFGLELTPEQAGVLRATQPTTKEKILGIIEECVNAGVDVASEILHRIKGGKKILVEMAHRKRLDHPEGRTKKRARRWARYGSEDGG